MNIIDKAIVLKLNKAWQPITQRTVRQAIVDLASEASSDGRVMAMDVSYARDDSGAYDLSEPIACVPVPWDDWIKLPVRPFDLSIATRSKAIRVPTVIVTGRYAGMPQWRPSPTRRAIFERDGGICQYSGRKVAWKEGNLDHVVPRSRGGPGSFENLVWSDRSINTRKANRSPQEAGLSLIRQPFKPPPIPMFRRFGKLAHRDWKWFVRGAIDEKT